MKKIALLSLLSVVVVGCSTGNNSAQELTSADSLLDNDIFTKATASNDLTRCNDILGNTLKAECIQIVDSRMSMDLALKNQDKSVCKKIKIERYKTECEKNVDSAIEARDADKNRLASEGSAVKAGDATLCDDIKSENDKASCKYNVLANQAIQTKDPSLCNQIGEEESVEMCKSQVNSN